MAQQRISASMKLRIAARFAVGPDTTATTSGAGGVAVRALAGPVLWEGFADAAAAEMFLAGFLTAEDALTPSRETAIDPRLDITEDLDGDWVIVLDGTSVFGIWESYEDSLPFAEQLSKTLIQENYYLSAEGGDIDPHAIDIDDPDDTDDTAEG